LHIFASGKENLETVVGWGRWDQ